MSRDAEFIAEAVALSAEALARPGTEPFGAVVVRDGVVVGRGLNHARATLDPTSHGETEAIRDACRRLGTLDLSGCEMFSSCEPCALCVAAAELAGIDRIGFALGLEEANAALAAVPQDLRRSGDVALLRAKAGAPAPGAPTGADGALDILRAWAAAQGEG